MVTRTFVPLTFGLWQDFKFDWNEPGARDAGYRESKASWLGVLQDLPGRGLKTPRSWPSARVPWAACGEAWRNTRAQPCWAHKTANVLNKLPKSIQVQGQHEIWRVETQAQPGTAFDRFVRNFGVNYPKAVEKRVKDRASLLAFFDFLAEHCPHIRATNPIDLSFATIRHRTTQAKNCVSRSTLLGVVFKLALAAEKNGIGWEVSNSCPTWLKAYASRMA